MRDDLIHIENFSKSFGDLKAVDDLSFDVKKGEVMAFLGANGSGKTTTIRCLLKIYTPDRGKLLIHGEEYSEKLNSKIGYLPEERGIYKDVTPLEILEYTAVLRGFSHSDAKFRAEKYLKEVDLFDHRIKKIAQLSSGMQQKVQLGTALIHEPEILILDEPFKGLDAMNRQLFVDKFIEQAKKGTTVLYSTHVIDEAQKMSDSVVMIREGKRVEYGTVSEVRKRYGSNNIVIEFSGKAPEKDTKLYRSTVTNTTAEIAPKDEDTDPNDVIAELVKNGTKIIKMEVDAPSLNDIFIELMSKKNE
ncbi:ATP-binding cassette domain-containing protein [Candidatus Dojkabacteria bacterium]|nr:ATP-binding cassette domain-containing protein [Candidatus Dojkabacteria bacterium]